MILSFTTHALVNASSSALLEAEQPLVSPRRRPATHRLEAMQTYSAPWAGAVVGLAMYLTLFCASFTMVQLLISVDGSFQQNVFGRYGIRSVLLTSPWYCFSACSLGLQWHGSFAFAQKSRFWSFVVFLLIPISTYQLFWGWLGAFSSRAVDSALVSIGSLWFLQLLSAFVSFFTRRSSS